MGGEGVPGPRELPGLEGERPPGVNPGLFPENPGLFPENLGLFPESPGLFPENPDLEI